ncbi:MAG: ATP-binding cassette domain-containing protein, partial [Deltaproteobacteria bacterium]|nr:ATP-binding cassette domain-containing protein [Deltaproteobacteria bacterium]
GGRTVLELPELTFEKGIVYALQGPNGSGKTTLLEILSLLSPPTSGRIRYDGRPVDFGRKDITALRREIVLLQQNPVLFTTTVRRNLEFGLRVRKVPREKWGRIVEEALDLVGMRGFLDAKAHRLSGGETQRVAIARALVCEPRVLFFDEPTSNVDVENQIAIERIIRDINAEKHLSVIFTTHNLIQGASLSHRAISLFDGKQVPTLFENIFAGNIVANGQGLNRCLLQGGIELFVKTEKEGKVRLSIDPLKLRIVAPDGRPPSAGSLLQGRVLQLTDEREHVRAVVDVGIPLNVLLSLEAAKAASLFVGNPAAVHCPPEAVRVF